MLALLGSLRRVVQPDCEMSDPFSDCQILPDVLPSKMGDRLANQINVAKCHSRFTRFTPVHIMSLDKDKYLTPAPR